MLDSPITWISALRLGLFWAGEYALLSLIEDAPVALKAATMICALAAILTLETRNWLNSKRANSFWYVITALSAVYAFFVAYAIYLSVYQWQTRQGLEERYVTAAGLAETRLTLKDNNTLDDGSVSQFANAFGAWENDTSDWILKRLNAAARERFLDRSGVLTYVSSGCHGNAICNEVVNRLGADRKNLAVIMETTAYER
jgi:hypothetical protein